MRARLRVEREMVSIREMRTSARHAQQRRHSSPSLATCEPWSSRSCRRHEGAQRLEGVRLVGALVLPPARYSREAHRDAGLVTRRWLNSLEMELEHLLRLH